MTHLEIYKKNTEPPKWALKEIQAGRLKGKTDINPQWRYQALTETFGLCGVGWYYETMAQWIESGSDGQKCAFVNINLFVKVDGEWSKAIPGSGGSMLIVNESKGAYTSDEAFKMATTDALSVACKMIGIAANIYSNTKYDARPDNTPPKSDANFSGMAPKKQILTDEQIDQLAKKTISEKFSPSEKLLFLTTNYNLTQFQIDYFRKETGI